MKIELVKDDKLKEMVSRSLRGHRIPACLYGRGRKAFRDARHDPLTELLREKIAFLAESIPSGVTVASLGVSDGEKEYLILKGLARKSCEYCAIDARSGMLDTVMARMDGLKVKRTSYVGFPEDLPKMRQHIASPLLLCCLGNSFCSFDPATFLPLLRQNLMPEDLLLLDCRLPGNGEQTAEQALPDIGLSPDSFEYKTETAPAATPAGQAFRSRSVLQIQKDCTLTVEATTLQLKKGEEFELGYTYSYTFSQFVTLLKRARLQIVRLFVSDAHDGLVALARPLEEGFLQLVMMGR